MKNLIYILSIVIIGCSSSSVNDEIQSEKVHENLKDTIGETPLKRESDLKDKSDFNLFYKKFITAITNKDTTAFNTFIHKDYGLYFIEAPGAMPMFVKIYSIENFKATNTQQAFFDLAFAELEKMPVNDSLPQIICDDNIYSKQGCFVQQTNPLNKSQLWNYSNLNDKQKQEVEIIVNTITHTVINTYNYTFYFSLIDENWNATFIDIRTPCSA